MVFWMITLFVVAPMAVVSGLLVITGMRVLRRNEGLGWHGVGMTEVVVGLLFGALAILIFINLGAP